MENVITRECQSRTGLCPLRVASAYDPVPKVDCCVAAIMESDVTPQFVSIAVRVCPVGVESYHSEFPSADLSLDSCTHILEAN